MFPRSKAARLAKIAGLLAALLPSAALAQPRAEPPTEQAKTERERELERIREEMQRAAAERQRLEAEILELKDDRAKLTAALVAAAADIRNAEVASVAAEERLGGLDKKDMTIRASLAGRRAVLAEVLAALQRMGLQPPPTMLARPDDALAAVRSAMLLGAVVPGMRAEVAALAGELQELAKVRAEIVAEREALERSRAEIAEKQRRLTALLEARRAQIATSETTAEQEKIRVASLARQADSLKDLIAAMERDIAAARRAAEQAQAVKPPPGDKKSVLAALQDAGRLAPAVAFVEAKGLLRLPVNGARLKAFGANDGFGGVEKGISIAARPEAQVTAPADGWVVYSGPFRSYGQLLIINAGGGYHILLAGMERVTVELGQFVLMGEPVARMGTTASPVQAAASAGQPVLYVEFRKDGVSIDPAPWWSVADSEKVRG